MCMHAAVARNQTQDTCLELPVLYHCATTTTSCHNSFNICITHVVLNALVAHLAATKHVLSDSVRG